MALRISYFTEAAVNENHAGRPIGGESRSVSASSANSGATPYNAVHIKLTAGEDTCYAYGANPTASGTASNFLKSGDTEWIEAVPGWFIAAITAA